MKRAVPQGSVLGPKLYLCYVNDIAQCFSNCQFYLFADDLAIVSVHKQQKLAEKKLQEDFNTFMLWSHDKELTINVTKTEILHITSPNVFKTGKVKILTHEIECLHVQNPQNWSRCDC